MIGIKNAACLLYSVVTSRHVVLGCRG